MAAIPVRLPPLPGEALDSWLEAYAHLLHATVRDIFDFAGMDWSRVNGDQRTGKPWLCRLDEPDLAALSSATGIAPETLAGMTLDLYQGTGLAEVTAPPGMRRTPRWWRQLSGSRYCPRCLAANGGRWMLAWRIPWTFACTRCQVLLADTCPDCGHRHRRTRTGQPRQPGRCDLTGLPLPPWHPPRGGAPSCTSDPVATPAVALPADGHVLAAQQHVDAIIAALVSSRGQPAGTAALQQYLDDACAVARAAVSAASGTAESPAAAVAVLEELGARPGPGAAASALASRSGGPRRQLAPVTAFGVTIADVMLHGRPGDPDPVIAGWLAGNTASRRNTTSPADVLTHWDRAGPALQAALAKPLAAQMDTFYQLRYRAVAGPARIPGPALAQEHAAVLPSLMWPGWALRLMPPGDNDFLRYRAALAMMLAVAVTGAEDYRTAQDLLGLEPFHPSRLATFTARLRQDGILEPVTAALCQLARKLEEHGAPVDYARRRRLRRISQAQLDTDSWRRQRYFLTHPATWAQRRHLDHATLPAAPVQEQLARLRLIELLTGTHPRYLPGLLRLPDRRSQDYAEFVFTMPEQLASCLDRQARTLLSKASISEPVTWEPPFDWAAGITWPGPDPDAISTEDLHPLIRAGLPVRAIAARLATRPDHVRLAADRHPAPRLPAGIPAPPPPEPEPPGTQQLRDLTSQGHGPREIARITGYSERVIRQLLTSGGLRHPAPPRDHAIDPHWLREQYQERQRSLKDIATETGIPVEALAAAARTAGIRVRHGINGRAHPLAALGGPGAFTTDVWNAFTHPGAEQRILRLLATPGQPSLQHAARQLGIRHALLAGQVRQLEEVVGTELLRTGPGGQLTLTAYGQRFARDVRPALESLAQTRKSKDDNHRVLARAPSRIVHLPGNQTCRELFNYNEMPSS
jgi:molybdenum-dependent DNA-binding transcriptional regulator ModE